MSLKGRYHIEKPLVFRPIMVTLIVIVIIKLEKSTFCAENNLFSITPQQKMGILRILKSTGDDTKSVKN